MTVPKTEITGGQTGRVAMGKISIRRDSQKGVGDRRAAGMVENRSGEESGAKRFEGREGRQWERPGADLRVRATAGRGDRNVGVVRDKTPVEPQ